MKLFLLLLFITLPPAAVSQAKKYIGYEHKGAIYGTTLPNGAKDLGGGLLSDENYGVSLFSKNGKFMLWLEKITGRDASGIPNWKVKDVLIFSKPKSNQEFLFSHSSGCRQNDRQNLDLIVQVEFLPKTETYKIVYAWRANVKKERFEKVSSKGIVCLYEAP
jgi:hypothetical protein